MWKSALTLLSQPQHLFYEDMVTDITYKFHLSHHVRVEPEDLYSIIQDCPTSDDIYIYMLYIYFIYVSIYLKAERP